MLTTLTQQSTVHLTRRTPLFLAIFTTHFPFQKPPPVVSKYALLSKPTSKASKHHTVDDKLVKLLALLSPSVNREPDGPRSRRPVQSVQARRRGAPRIMAILAAVPKGKAAAFPFTMPCAQHLPAGPDGRVTKTRACDTRTLIAYHHGRNTLLPKALAFAAPPQQAQRDSERRTVKERG